MGTVFEKGATLVRGDLDIFITDSDGNPVNAYSIVFALYFVDPTTGSEVLIGPSDRTPVNPDVGEYYASLMIPTNASAGGYRIRWVFQETATSGQEGAVQEFGVIGDEADATTDVYTECVTDLISKLRTMARDNNPQRNYHFRPPEGEGTVSCYNQVLGFIWEDSELAEYLEIALWKWNTLPPNSDKYRTIDMLCQQKPSWKAALLWGALVNAAQALAYGWVADEFDYSIGGISLSIEKSSKYMDLKRNAEEQWDKLGEAKKATSLFMRGLSQSKYGRGVKGSLGPSLGKGQLGPRSFLQGFVVFGFSSYSVIEVILNHAHLSSMFS